MVGEQLAVGAQRVDRVDQRLQALRVVEVGHLVAELRRAPARGSSRRGGCGPARGRPGSASCRRRVAAAASACRARRPAGRRRVTISDTGAVTCFRRRRCQRGAHRQRVLADRDGDAERRAQLHADGAARCRRARRPRRARRRPPSSCRQLDARQLDRRGQQVGDRLADRHAARTPARRRAPAACARRSPSPRRRSRRSRPG